MKTIYDLEVKLAHEPEQVDAAQALTLDDTRPGIGLAGTHGLFGSNEWWRNLKSGVIPTTIYEGAIKSIQFEGMNNEGRAFTLMLKGGGTYTYSCVANEKPDLGAYAVGRQVRVTTFTEPKKNGDGLEMVWTVEIEVG